MKMYFFSFSVVHDTVKGVNTEMRNNPGEVESIESVFFKPS